MSDAGEAVSCERQLEFSVGHSGTVACRSRLATTHPSASSWENPVGLDAAPSDMDIDRSVDMPPAEPPVV